MNALDKIKIYLNKNQWSEYQLAKVSGLPQSTINSLFRKNNMPSIPTLEAMCRAFGISMSEFFDDSNEKEYLTQSQLDMLANWNNLSQTQKDLIMKLISELSNSNNLKEL